MRILIYSLNYAPELTATGKYTGELAEWLVQRGHEVEVIAGLPHYPKWRVDPKYAHIRYRRESLNGVRVHRTGHYVPDSRHLSARARIRMELSFALRSIRFWLPQLFSRRFDVVIAICPPLQLGLFPWLYGSLRRVPWIIHVQDLQIDAAVGLGMLRGRLSQVLYGIERFLLRRADGVSTIGEAMRRRLIAKGVPAERTLLTRNWADTERVQPQGPSNPFREAICGESPTGRCVFMYAGNVGEKQGLEILLDAATRLSTDDRIRFAIVGDGAKKSQLMTRAGELGLRNIAFLPVQPAEHLSELLAAADAHLVIQKRDAADLVLPSKLSNILAAGRPCIATADPGTELHDMIEQNEIGIAVRADDVDGLMAAIQALASDADRRRIMGENAHLTATERLSKALVLSAFEHNLECIARSLPVATADYTGSRRATPP